MARTNKQIFNAGDLNKVGAVFRQVQLGSGLALVARTFQGTVTSNVLTLPEFGKAMAILDAFALAGTSDGRKTVIAKEGAPAAGQVAIDPKGDIIFNATDAITSAEVVYIPAEGTIFEETVDVTAAGAATLRQSRRALQLLEASLDTGGGVSVPGAKTIVARADGAPSAGQARLEIDGEVVFFNGTDAGTGGTATIKYIASPGVTGTYDAFGDLIEDDYPEI